MRRTTNSNYILIGLICLMGQTSAVSAGASPQALTNYIKSPYGHQANWDPDNWMDLCAGLNGTASSHPNGQWDCKDARGFSIIRTTDPNAV